MSVAIAFDFDHTLGLDNGLERRAFGLLAERLGTPIDIHDESRQKAIEDALAPFRRGDEPIDAAVTGFIATLPPRVLMLDTQPDAFTELYRQLCYGLIDELVEPLDGARACIEELVALGVSVGILTNGWTPLQEKKIARAIGDFPGPILVSDAIGAYKPSAKAFRRLEMELRMPPDQLWYVGDNPVIDIAGAHEYGLHTVWFDWEGATYPGDIAPPDARIASLSELPALVRGRKCHAAKTTVQSDGYPKTHRRDAP